VAEVILALDLPGATEALRLLDRLPELKWVKVGSVLMTREGAPFIESLRARGLEVFLDLKWHDIPNTVAGAVTAARELGVSMATVHTLGGRKMMEAAAQAAGGAVRLVGVTVLTSHDDTTYGEAVGRTGVSIQAEVARLALAAQVAGLDGVVCSPLEIAGIRRTLGPQAIVVVPGIRRPEDPGGDQQRTATPHAAVAAGASHLVVGRPVVESEVPEEALRSMFEATS
jgi:orotidine-5'-phosphate decarboxylase